MPLLTLPRAGDPGGADAARVQLQTVIDDTLNVVLVLYGEEPAFDIRQALDVAVGRASAKSEIRRVVWCPDPDVLTDDQRASYFRKNKVGATVGLADRVAATLSLKEAQDGLKVELAFLEAESQTPTLQE
jgi:hypothetical protein